MRAYQLTYGLMMGDAISNHVVEIDIRLQQWGYTTATFAQYVAPEMGQFAQTDPSFEPYLQDTDALLIYHYSIYSPNTRLYQQFTGRKILIYHNITPGEHFLGWDSQQAAQCQLGRDILATLQECDFAIGDSEFNRQELLVAGFDETKTAVLPIFLKQDHLQNLPDDAAILNQFQQDGLVHWLTVGRLVPNKAVEDVIRVFAVYHQRINAHARLHLVGTGTESRYGKALQQLVYDLELDMVVNFAGRVTDAQLKTYYQLADLYLTTSKHEGFCVPLIESMYFGIPIIAHHATAIPETLGDAGILFTALGYEAVAEMAHLLLTDEALRQTIIHKQKERLQAFAPDTVAHSLQAILERLGLPHE